MTDQVAQGGLQDRPLTLAGQTFTIRVGVKAWLALQDKWDLDEEAARNRVKTGKLRDLPAIIWAVLRSHHPQVSEEDVLTLLDDAGVDGIVDGVQKLLRDSDPPPQ